VLLLKVRDRDAPVTREGLIFRVMGYDHPPNACFCDVEYAPSSLYTSRDPRAYRCKNGVTYYKFYGDEGLRFVEEKFPEYRVFHEAMGSYLVGLREEQIREVRRPDERILEIVGGAEDPLIRILLEVLDLVTSVTSLSIKDFGVFGSLLHNIYNVNYSDLDFIIYGYDNLQELLEGLKELYRDSSSGLRNEYRGPEPPDSRYRHFKDYTVKEYMWHQRRKLIYAVYEKGWRPVKIEFEPVRDWGEIVNEYPHLKRIEKVGFVKAIIYVTDDRGAPFMPSIYGVEVLEASDKRALEAYRVVSYVEEYRMQLRRGEKGFVRGWLERLEWKGGEETYQITLTYARENYSRQILKVLSKNYNRGM